MIESLKPWLLLVTAICLDSLGSVLFKHGVNQLPEATRPGWRGHLDTVTGALGRKEIALGLAVYVLESITWLATLSYLDLGLAFALFSANNILILAASRVFLGETISRRRWLGVAIIILGILLVGHDA